MEKFALVLKNGIHLNVLMEYVKLQLWEMMEKYIQMVI